MAEFFLLFKNEIAIPIIVENVRRTIYKTFIIQILNILREKNASAKLN